MHSPSPQRPRDDFDRSWKHAMEHFLQPILALCFPEIDAQIDWSQPPEFMQQELDSVAPEGGIEVQRGVR